MRRGEGTPSGELAPLLVLMAVFAAVTGAVATRKGRRVWLWALLGALFTIVTLASGPRSHTIVSRDEWVNGTAVPIEARSVPVESAAGPEVSPFWDYMFLAAFAIIGAYVAGSIARQNGRRAWIWAPVGALFPLIAPIGARFLEGSPRDFGLPISTGYGLASVISAAWAGYLARSKHRRVWLWIVLGAVLPYIALMIVAFSPGRGETLIERTLSAPIETPRDSRFRTGARRRKNDP